MSASLPLTVAEVDRRIDVLPCAVINGRTVLRRELKQAFDRVANPKDWKGVIMAELTPLEVTALGGEELIRQAVIFFTGSVPAIFPGPVSAGDVIRVAAAGYRHAMGEL